MFEERLERIRIQVTEFKRLRLLKPMFKSPRDWNVPATLEEVEEFERKWRLQLPPHYREFILKIGNGGLGPGFGLEPLVDYRVVPFPFGWHKSEHRFIEMDDLTGHEKLEGELALVVAWIDVALEDLIVVRGSHAGEVWRRNDEGLKGCLQIETSVWQDKTLIGSQPSTFLDWYENWLDDALDYLRRRA